MTNLLISLSDNHPKVNAILVHFDAPLIARIKQLSQAATEYKCYCVSGMEYSKLSAVYTNEEDSIMVATGGTNLTTIELLPKCHRFIEVGKDIVSFHFSENGEMFETEEYSFETIDRLLGTDLEKAA